MEKGPASLVVPMYINRRKRWLYRAHCCRNNAQYMSRLSADYLKRIIKFYARNLQLMQKAIDDDET